MNEQEYQGIPTVSELMAEGFTKKQSIRIIQIAKGFIQGVTDLGKIEGNASKAIQQLTAALVDSKHSEPK